MEATGSLDLIQVDLLASRASLFWHRRRTFLKVYRVVSIKHFFRVYTDTRISVNSLPSQQKTQKNDSAVQEIQEIKLKAQGKSNPS